MSITSGNMGLARP